MTDFNSLPEFDHSLSVNVSETVNVIRHFVADMFAKNRGVIVNLSSDWDRSVSAEVAPYCATKWAIEGLTRALAQETAVRNVRGSAESRDHQHRHAEELFCVRRGPIS